MQSVNRFIDILIRSHTDESVVILEQLPAAQTVTILQQQNIEVAAKLLRKFNPGYLIELTNLLPDSFLLQIMFMLELNDIVFILRRLSSDRINNIVSALPEKLQPRIRYALKYPQMTAGALADTNVFTITDDLTCKDALTLFYNNPARSLYYIYALNREHKLTGVMSIKELVMHSENQLIFSAMTPNPLTMPANMPFHTIIQHEGWKQFHALPVTDVNDVFLGVIRHKQVHTLMAQQKAQTSPDHNVERALGELYWLGLSGIIFSPIKKPDSDND